MTDHLAVRGILCWVTINTRVTVTHQRAFAIEPTIATACACANVCVLIARLFEYNIFFNHHNWRRVRDTVHPYINKPSTLLLTDTHAQTNKQVSHIALAYYRECYLQLYLVIHKLASYRPRVSSRHA